MRFFKIKKKQIQYFSHFSSSFSLYSHLNSTFVFQFTTQHRISLVFLAKKINIKQKMLRILKQRRSNRNEVNSGEIKVNGLFSRRKKETRKNPFIFGKIMK